MKALQRFVDVFDRKNCNLLDLRCLTGFTGFSRVHELLDVQLQHFAWLPDHIQVSLPHSKVHQHRDGDSVFIARTGTKYWPRGAYPNILGSSGARYRKRQNAFLIPRLHKTKKGAQGIQNEGYFLYQNERNFP